MIMERGLAMWIVIRDHETRPLASMIVGAAPFEGIGALTCGVDRLGLIVMKDAIGKL
jgi:hypothetical protein